MAFEYKPGAYDKPFNQWRCRAAVYARGSTHAHQCSRRPVNDGWCKQHHPDVEVARRQASLERSHRKFENRPYTRCLRKLEKVTAQRDLLLAALEAEEAAPQHARDCLVCETGGICNVGYPLTIKAASLRQAAIAAVKGEGDGS